MLDFNQVINRYGTDCTQWDYVEDRFGKQGLLPFTISDTDFLVPEAVQKKLEERISHGIFGYTRWDHMRFKSAVQKWYKKRFNLDISDEWLIYSPTVIYSISTLIDMFSKKGEGVIIQTPAYDAFFKTIKGNQRRVVDNPLDYQEGQYTINMIDLEEKLADPKNKILLLCSPHNPTGRVWNQKELKEIVSLCKKYQVFLISDEIHMDILRKDSQHQPILNFIQENVAIVTSGSKTFNFPGLIFSYVILPSKKIREEFKYKLKSQDGLSSTSILGMEATITAYEECADWVDQLKDYLDENLQYVERILTTDLPKIKLSSCEATYLPWLDISGLNRSISEIQRELIEIGNVAIMDGSIYGGNGEKFLRLNIGCSRSKIELGMEKMVLSLQ